MVVKKSKLHPVNKKTIIRDILTSNSMLKVKWDCSFAINLNSEQRQENKVDIDSYVKILKFTECHQHIRDRVIIKDEKTLEVTKSKE